MVKVRMDVSLEVPDRVRIGLARSSSTEVIESAKTLRLQGSVGNHLEVFLRERREQDRPTFAIRKLNSECSMRDLVDLDHGPDHAPGHLLLRDVLGDAHNLI